MAMCLFPPTDSLSTYFEIAGARERAAAGEKALAKYETFADNSVCWKGAVSRLDAGCRALSDISQSKLAIAFTNCHLEKSDKKTYPCPEDATIADCTREMDIIAFQAYTEFFTHTGHICFFLQSQVWQEKTESAVSRLTDNSEAVAGKLQESLGYHRQLLEYEKLSLDNQQVLMAADKELKESLLNSSEKLQLAFKEMNQTSNEVFGNFFVWLKKIAAFQSLALGEFISIKTILFYFVGIIVAYLLTATPRTNGARFWVYVVLVVTFMLERMLISGFLGSGDIGSDGIETLHWSYWWLRNVSVVVCLVVMVYKAFVYRDYMHENNRMLMSIKREIENMKGVFTISKEPAVTRALPDSSSAIPTSISDQVYSVVSASPHPSVSEFTESNSEDERQVSILQRDQRSSLSDMLDFPDGPSSSLQESDKSTGRDSADEILVSSAETHAAERLVRPKHGRHGSNFTPKQLSNRNVQLATMSSGRYNLRSRRGRPSNLTESSQRLAASDNKSQAQWKPLTLSDVKRRLYHVAADARSHFQDTVERLTPASSGTKRNRGRKDYAPKQIIDSKRASSVQFSDGEY